VHGGFKSHFPDDHSSIFKKSRPTLLATENIILDNITPNLLNLRVNDTPRFLQLSLLLIFLYTIRFFEKPVKRNLRAESALGNQLADFTDRWS
jgi:hypothetical protein